MSRVLLVSHLSNFDGFGLTVVQIGPEDQPILPRGPLTWLSRASMFGTTLQERSTSTLTSLDLPPLSSPTAEA